MLSLTTAIQYDSVTFHSVSFVSAKFHRSTINSSPPLSLLIEKFQMMLTPPKLCTDVIYQPFITMETLYNYLREIRKKIINLEHVTYARVRTFNVFLGCSPNKIQTWPWYFVEQSAIEVINSFIAELLIPLSVTQFPDSVAHFLALNSFLNMQQFLNHFELVYILNLRM